MLLHVHAGRQGFREVGQKQGTDQGQRHDFKKGHRNTCRHSGRNDRQHDRANHKALRNHIQQIAQPNRHASVVVFLFHIAQVGGGGDLAATGSDGINRQIGPSLFGNSGLVEVTLVFQNTLCGEFTNRAYKFGVAACKNLVLRFVQYQQLGWAMLCHSGGAVGLVRQERHLTQ